MSLLILAFTISFISTLLLHPKVVRVARLKGITDDPGERKLQRHPVPVLGGVVVFFGITLGVGLTTFDISYRDFMLVFAMIVLMLFTGTLDDVTGLTPYFRFFIECLATLALIFIGSYCINDFHGLWGVNILPAGVAVLLTVLAVIGIINSINLIDGVDGLSSGYCILACICFAIYFTMDSDTAMGALAVAAIGALIPFFVYNVFGNRSKMFIGDGGTLMMGIILSIFVLRVLSVQVWDWNLVPTDNLKQSIPLRPQVISPSNLGLVPMTLAILSIPVADALRVMINRMLHNKSPFNADKSHIHHALLSCGLSHLATTLTIIGLNVAIIVGWIILVVCGASIDTQFYAVVGTAIGADLLVYLLCTRHINNGSDLNE